MGGVEQPDDDRGDVMDCGGGVVERSAAARSISSNPTQRSGLLKSTHFLSSDCGVPLAKRINEDPYENTKIVDARSLVESPMSITMHLKPNRSKHASHNA